MEDQKLENLLNLALDATEEEREKSPELEAGYDPGERTWELIVRYSGSLEEVRDMGIRVEELLSGYAILWAPQSRISEVSRLPQIEYMEKPKRLFFAVYQARAASCLAPLQEGGLGLTGKGTLVAVLDSGIDYFHPDFRNEDGSTRILLLWDQVLDRIFTQEEINEALQAGSRRDGLSLVPSVDPGGHGTAVAGIAAGNGRESGGRNRGVAYESQLLVVRLGVPEADGFPRTTQLMRAVDFAVRTGARLGMPTAVNISFGNTYGSHDGTSLLETFLDEAAGFGRNVIVVGTGNEGGSGGHTSGRLEMGREEEILLSVAPFETGFSVQLWKSYADRFRIRLAAPSGEEFGPFPEQPGTRRYRYRETEILLYYGEPSPYSQAQEIFFDFLPGDTYLNSGVWRILLEPVRLVTGRFDLWLPSHSSLNPATRFLAPVPDITLTIPSTARKVISVGAYDASYQSYAQFSGRGYTRVGSLVKPELSAPGTDILTTLSGGGYGRVTGTSFAAPFVTGTSSLLMEWGINQGNDPYLYGEKVKARLIRGARHLSGFAEWPNPELGYGVLCAADSL
ncbi:MAG: S8 family peptidase [Lachnospiraceae bacterium]|nr:S8 family peptidase [Lachnospiraceae bacterium]